MKKVEKILVIKRDNIGDLICALPLISEIKRLKPRARIDALVNSYCAPIVFGNRCLDNIFIYTKAKHKSKGSFSGLVYLKRVLLTAKLIFTRYDYIVLANVGYLPRPLRWAKLLMPKYVIGYVDGLGQKFDKIITHPINLGDFENRHEILSLVKLAEPFGRTNVDLKLDYNFLANRYMDYAKSVICAHNNIKIGINISARLPSQKWDTVNYIDLVRRLSNKYKCILFWAPGDQLNSSHPGDDSKAYEILFKTRNCNVIPFKTDKLEILIAGVSCVDFFITPDGGSMHIAAMCQKPIVALFGNSNEKQWFPWGVRNALLKTRALNVNDISSADVEDALLKIVQNSIS